MSIVLCVRPIVGTTQRLTMTKRRDGNGQLHGAQWTLIQNLKGVKLTI
jgi:hypothetical protein